MDESLVFSPPDVALLDEAMRMAEEQLAAEAAASSAVPSAAAAALAPQHRSKAPQQPAPQARGMPQPEAQLLLSSSSWGLPANFVAQYKRKGVEKLYSWQCDCLRRPECSRLPPQHRPRRRNRRRLSGQFEGSRARHARHGGYLQTLGPPPHVQRRVPRPRPRRPSCRPGRSEVPRGLLLLQRS